MIMTDWGNVYKRSDGYYQVSSGAYKGKLLHRLIYEANYGPIPKGFCVHHKDNDKSNNSPSNLMLLSKSNHHKLHMAGITHPRWDKGRIDSAGGLSFLSLEKNKGASIKEVSVELGYTNAAPIYQYLNNRDLRWNQL